MTKNSVTIECTSAFMLGGSMVTPGQRVSDVPMKEAVELARRGKAKMPAADSSTHDDVDEDDLAKLTVEELRAMAKGYEIEGVDKMKKGELIAAIEAAEAAIEDAGDDE